MKTYTPQFQERAKLALALRRSGMTFREIGEAMRPVDGKRDHITKAMARIYVVIGERLERRSNG